MPLAEGYPYLEAEVRYACREYAATVEDVLSRRTRLAFLNSAAALECVGAPGRNATRPSARSFETTTTTDAARAFGGESSVSLAI